MYTYLALLRVDSGCRLSEDNQNADFGNTECCVAVLGRPKTDGGNRLCVWLNPVASVLTSAFCHSCVPHLVSLQCQKQTQNGLCLDDVLFTVCDL